MAAERGLLVLVVIMAAIVETDSQSYMVLSPQQFSPGSVLPVYAEMISGHVPYENIEARLVRELAENIKENVTAKNITIAAGMLTLGQANKFGTIDLHVPRNMTWGQYRVTIKGSGIIAFENSSHIYLRRRYGPDGAGIFVQTDKALYKAGQKVLYRIFMVDRDLKPQNPEFYVAILDPRRNKIQERTWNQDDMVMSGELQLSEHPPLGRWTIHVKVKDGGTVDYSFEVNEYVLPKWSVTVHLPENGEISNPELKGSVKAKYTYGKPVKGSVVLTIRKRYGRRFHDPAAIQTHFSINGDADFIIPTDALMRLDPQLSYDTLVVEANVTEPATGTTFAGSSEISFHKETFTIEFMNHWSEYFKPGFKYTTHVKIVQSDGRPLPSSGKPVKISVTYFTERNATSSPLLQPPFSAGALLMTFISPFPGGQVMFMPDIYVPLPSDGMLTISLDVPDTAATGRLIVQYSEREIIKQLQRFRSDSDSYIHLDMATSNVKVGKQAEFSVSSNKVPSGRITYHIVFEDEIIETHYTSINTPFTPTVFYVTMTTAMTPNAKIVAYYLTESGEIVADALQFNVQFAFENEVSVTFDKKQVEPGSTVSLNIRADPESIVNVLVVDKSVKLLKRGNDITTDRVFGALGIGTAIPEWQVGGRYLPTRIGNTDDSFDVFQKAGLNLMTDAKITVFNMYNAYSRSHMYSARASYFEDSIDVNEMLVMPRLRKDFPETWIWTNQTVGTKGTVDISGHVPDTITDWVATAFALNRKTGLGIGPEPANLTVFLPFYVNLQLPYSLVRGEVVAIQALVFNYYPYDMYVSVTLKESKDFIGIVMDHFSRREHEVDGNIEQCILVKADDVATAYFTIRPVRAGSLDIQVEAASYRASDAIRRTVVVKPPGEPEEKNIPVMVYLDEGSMDKQGTTIPIRYPHGDVVVSDTERLRITVIGDIFGSSFENLDRLIQIPHGCGEQTMVLFAPAVYAAAYLLATNRYMGGAKERVEHALTTGYQRQLLYQRHDGSFSAFGAADQDGSLWLTAFVVKSFAQANRFVYIDPDVVARSLQYLINHQRKDGSFNKIGVVHHKAMQGSSAANNRSLAAYVLIALVEVHDHEVITNKTTVKRLITAISLASAYLQTQHPLMTDDYETAISAYAFSRLSFGEAAAASAALGAIVDKINKGDKKKGGYNDVKSHVVEIAAYTLLTFSQLKDRDRGVPVLRWLLEQRNSHGGFVSTQDTVIGLQALAAYAELTYTPNVSLAITVKTPSRPAKTFTVNTENKDVLQFVDIPGRHENVSIFANGSGIGLVEVGVFYNVEGERSGRGFDLILTTANDSGVNSFTVTACFRWLERENSGMVLLDMGFPSGYVPDRNTVRTETFQGAGKHPSSDFRPVIKRVEMAGDRLVVYFDEVGEEMACVTMKAGRESIVAHAHPATVRVYSYYDPQTEETTFLVSSSE